MFFFYKYYERSVFEGILYSLSALVSQSLVLFNLFSTLGPYLVHVFRLYSLFFPPPEERLSIFLSLRVAKGDVGLGMESHGVMILGDAAGRMIWVMRACERFEGTAHEDLGALVYL